MSALILAGIDIRDDVGRHLARDVCCAACLPRHHLNEHAKDVVRLGVGLIATIAALVLGLLIGCSKGFLRYTNHANEADHCQSILLDNVLAQYGPEARPIRQHIRNAVGPLPTGSGMRSKQLQTVHSNRMLPKNRFLEIQKLSPQKDFQRSLQSRAVQVSNDLAQLRFMLFVESESLIPTPFLAILAFWLVIVFASYSLFSPLNGTLFTCLSLFAFSAACAIF